MDKFSDSTLYELSKDKNKKFYVYCLVDPIDKNVFYIGKGTGNRIFAHEQFALGVIRDSEFIESHEFAELKIERIKKIYDAGNRCEKFIISYGLTENEAFASELTLINYFKILRHDELLTNKVGGHGSVGMSVGELEKRYGYTPISINEIKADGLILAVKIKDSFNLSTDDNGIYGLTDAERDSNNLKSRTLGRWVIGKNMAEEIKYVIGINTGANNSVVSAYKVKSYQSMETEKGNYRYIFHSDSNHIEVLKELGLYKKCLPDSLNFGSGSAITYIGKDKFISKRKQK